MDYRKLGIITKHGRTAQYKREGKCVPLPKLADTIAAMLETCAIIPGTRV